MAMSDLRDLLGGLGFEDVRSLLQSGNALPYLKPRTTVSGSDSARNWRPAARALAEAEGASSGCAKRTTSCSQTVPAAGVTTSTRYLPIAWSAHADRKR